MGTNGCRWGFVGAMGCRDTKSQQNEVIGDKNGKNDMFCEPVTGDISPNVMFL